MTTGTPPAGTPPAGTPPAGTPPAGGGDWIAGISDEPTRAWVTTKGYKDPGALANSALNLEKLLGAPRERLLQLPGDDKPESWQPVWQKLGVPEKPEGYKLPVPQGDKGEFAKTAANWFHKHNVPAKAAEGIAAEWNGFVAAQVKSQQDAFETAGAASATKLKTEWGDAHEQNMQVAKEAVKAFGFSEAEIDALQRVVGYDGVMKRMHALGTKIGEAPFAEGGRPPAGGKLAPAQAQGEIQRLRGDPDFVKRWNAGESEARNELKRLNEMAYPGNVVLG